jgi:hypothetical protein
MLVPPNGRWFHLVSFVFCRRCAHPPEKTTTKIQCLMTHRSLLQLSWNQIFHKWFPLQTPQKAMKETTLLKNKRGQPTKGPYRVVCKALEPPKSPRRRFLRGWNPRASPSPISSGTGCPLNGALGLVRELDVSRTTQWSSGCRLWRWWICHQGQQLRQCQGNCLLCPPLKSHRQHHRLRQFRPPCPSQVRNLE